MPSRMLARNASFNAVSGKALIKRVDHRRESLVREEDAGKDPHGHHHEVDEPADALDLLGAAGGEQSHTAERQRSNRGDQ